MVATHSSPIYNTIRLFMAHWGSGSGDSTSLLSINYVSLPLGYHRTYRQGVRCSLNHGDGCWYRVYRGLGVEGLDGGSALPCSIRVWYGYRFVGFNRVSSGSHHTAIRERCIKSLISLRTYGVAFITASRGKRSGLFKPGARRHLPEVRMFVREPGLRSHVQAS